MTLSAGSRLGPYEILSPIGAGGMGEVYKARDTRLDRTVAVKILPATFASDEILRLRFEREAKTISQLSHPNICTLHDVGQASVEAGANAPGDDSAVHYLVMEYLEGGNLAERLARGKLSLAESLRLGIEVASALDCAHRSGVIHRDLKPANVMLTRTGARLVDFGLARSGLAPASRQHDATMRLESDGPLTERGTILGTWQYMAPEQLAGEDVDQRADIFALGAILYEAVTGRKAFSGSSISGLMTAVLTADPLPIRESHPEVPMAYEQLVRGMLAKDRDHRVQTAHDVSLQLQWILESMSQPSGRNLAPLVPASRRRWRMAVATAAVAALAAIATLALRTAPAPPPPLVRFSLPVPRDLVYNTNLIAVSPDGRQIVYSLAPLGGRSSLWLRNLEREEARILANTEGAYNPFFSPDGRWVGFFSGDQMRKINLDDGTVESICEARGFGGATWGSSGVILFSPRYESEIWRVDASGGTPSRETAVTGKSLNIWPHFLPDGERYIYLFWNPEGGGIMTRRLGSKEETMLLPVETLDDMTIVQYASERLFFVRKQSLFAQRVDPRTLALEGAPRRIAEGVRFHGPGMAPFAVSAAGTVAWLPDGSNVQSELLVVDRSGVELRRIGEPVALSEFAVSPDGELIAASIELPLKKRSIWLIDVARGSRTPSVEGWAEAPVWLPDGSGFVFSTAKDGPPNLHRVSLGREIERLSRSAEQQIPTSITKDGLIVYDTLTMETMFDVRTLRLDGSEDTPVLGGKFSEEGGRVSPDGRWLAFVTNESGRAEVYITAFPKPERRWQVSEDGGGAPRWSRDGRELFFLSRGRLMRSRITPTDRIAASVPDQLFDIAVADYDTMPGDRFLIAQRQLNPSRPPLNVISGWQNLTAD